MKNIEPNFNNSWFNRNNIQSAKSESSDIKCTKKREGWWFLAAATTEREMPRIGRTTPALR